MKVKGGSRRKEIRIMLGNDRRSKMPTAPISFSMNHFFLFHSGKNNFVHEPLFPFSLGQKYFFLCEPLFPFSLGQKVVFLWTTFSFFTRPKMFSMNPCFLFSLKQKNHICLWTTFSFFHLAKKKTVNASGQGNAFFFFKSAPSKLSTRMKIKMETFQGALHF